MVRFELTDGASFIVFVNEKPFGWVSKQHGFHVDSTVVNDFIEVTASDLRKIADKIDELKAA